MVPLLSAQAGAGTLYWDGGSTDLAGNGNGISLGTSGTWDTTIKNWDQGAVPYVAWNNLNQDIAVFGGTAGTVTVGAGGVVVGGLTFNTTAYTLAAGTNGLTFGTGTNLVQNIMSTATTAASITGTVGGTGANLNFSSHPLSNTTLTFSGISSTGWTGSTTINSNYTLATTTTSGNINQVLNSTSGITLNGGAIQFNRAANAQLNAISDSATITVNGGGTFGVTSADAGGANAIETIGAVTVNSGQMNFNWTNGASSGAQIILSGLTRSGTSALTFSGALATTGRWKVTGAGTTTAGEIIGAWATTGAANGVGAQNDYAVYSGDFVAAAGIAASAESTWSTTHAATSNYTLSNSAGSAANGRLTATRNVNSIRNTSGVVNLTSVDATANTITVTGSSFANGDVVQIGGTAPGGLANNTVYYVVGASGTTFQLAATSGGAAVDLTSAGTANIAGGITLSTGNNLGTFGILNGSTALLSIGGSGTGAVTLPTASGGNLYVTAGAAGIAINAPIANNTGALTLVKSGSSGLFLSGTNTYTGGTVINAGTLNFLTAGSWVSGQNITFGGAGTITASVGALTGGTLTVDQGAVGVINGSSAITFTTTSGAGTIIRNGGATNAGNLNLGDASGFTGILQISQASGTNPRPIVTFSNLGDGGALQYGGGQGDSNQKITIQFNGTNPLTWNTRQVQIVPRTNSNNLAKSMVLDNNSAIAANALVINTDLLNSADRTGQGFILGGSNTGNNEFAGDIGNSTLNNAALGVFKNGAGRWILSGSNTFTGLLVVGQGTLSVGTFNEITAAGPLGMGSIQLGGDERAHNNATELILTGNNSGTLEYTGGAVASTRSFRIGDTAAASTGGGTIANNGTGAMTFTAANFNPTQTGITATRTLTLAGSNAGANDIQGVIQDNVATTGVLALVKSGAGRWILSGTNTYSGTTTVNGGTLVMANTQAFGTGAAARIILSGGGIADIATNGGDTAYNVTVGSNALGTIASNRATTGAAINHTLGTLNIGASTTAGSTRLDITTGSNVTSGTASITLAGITLGSGSATTPSISTLNPTTANLIVGTVTATNAAANPKTLNLDGTSSANQITGSISNGVTTVAVLKTNTSTWTLTGASTYTGETSITAGSLIVNGSLGDTAVTVGNGTPDSGILSGTGTIANIAGKLVTVAGGGAISPGNSVGTLTTGSETWNGGGTYIWEINDANGVDNAGNTAANQGSSWDLLDITGGLTVASTTGSPFLIKFTTLAGTTPGAAADFNPLQAYEWTIARTTGVTGFDANAFVLNTAGFVDENGDFAVVQSGNNINVTYTPVPEPGVLGMLAFGGIGLLTRRRRRLQSDR